MTNVSDPSPWCLVVAADCQGVGTTSETLLQVLEDLRHEEFTKFKWFLHQPGSLEGFTAIKRCRLENAKPWDTVDVMVQKYGLPGAVEVTRKVLEKISRNDLVQSLSGSSSEPGVDVSDGEGTSETRAASSSQAPLPHAEDVMVPVPEPQPITYYQRMLLTDLEDGFVCVTEGWSVEEQHLEDGYTELYITAGPDSHLNTQHEVRQKHRPAEGPVKLRDLFKHPDKYRRIRTVLANGIAGIGKTVLVNKASIKFYLKGVCVELKF